jgi:predicted membrane protein
MIYCLISAIFRGSSRNKIVVLAAIVCICVEVFRLYHSPWLDNFRLTLAGQLLLGRIFSLWNLVAYAAGIILATLVDRSVGLK